MAYNAGTAFLQIVPSFRGFTRLVQAEAVAAGKVAGEDAGNEYGKQFKKAAEKSSADTKVGPDKVKAAKDGAASGGAFATAFAKSVKAAEAAIGDIEIGVATSQAEQDVRDFRIKMRAELAEISNARIGVDIDESQALARLANLQANLRALGSSSSSVAVRVDTAKALAELAKVQAAVEHLDGQEPVIKPKVDSLAAQRGLSGLHLSIAALAPALIPITAAAVVGGVALGGMAAAGTVGMGVAALALRGVADAVKAGSAAARGGEEEMKKYKEELAKLTPVARGFVMFMVSEMLPRFREMQRVAAEGFLPGLERGMRAAIPIFEPITRLIGATALAMGGLAEATGRALGSPFWVQWVNYMTGAVGPNLRILGAILGNLAKGLAGLAQAFEPMSRSVGEGLVRLSAGFARFGESAAAGTNKAFNGFIAYVREVGPQVGELLKALAAAAANIIRAFTPWASVLVPILTSLANVIARMPPELILGIAAAFYTLAAALKIATLVNATVIAIGNLQFALATLAANPIVLAIAGIVALYGAVYIAYQRFEQFRNVVNKIGFEALALRFVGVWGVVAVQMVRHWDAIAGAVTNAWNNHIRPVLAGIGEFVNATVTPAFRVLAAVAVVTWRGITEAVQGAWVILRAIFDAIGTVLNATVVPAFRLLRAVVGPILSELAGDAREWGAVIRVVFDAVGAVLANIVPIFRAFAAAAQAAFALAARAGQIMWDTLRAALSGVGNVIDQFVLPPLRLLGAVAAAQFAILGRAAQAAWDVVRPILTLLGSILTATVVPVLRLFGTVAATAFTAAGAAISAFWGLVRPIFTAIASVLQNNVFPVVRAFAATVVGPTFQDAGRFISAFWNNIAQPALSAFSTYIVGPVGTAVRAFGAVIASVFAAAGRVVAVFWDAARSVFEAVRTYIAGPFSAVWSFIGRHIDTVLNAIRIALIAFNAVVLIQIGAVVAFLQGPGARAWNAFRDVVGNVLTAATGFVQRFLADVQRIFGALHAFFAGAVTVAWNGFRTLVDTTFRFAQSFVDRFSAGLQRVFGAIHGFFAGPVTIAWNGFRNLVDTTFRLAQSFLERFWAAVQRIFGLLHGFFAGAVTVAWNGFRNLVDTTFRLAQQFAQRFWDALRAIFTTLHGFLAGPVAAAWTGFRNLVDGVFRFLVNAANVFNANLQRIFTTLRNYLAGPLSAAFTTFRDVASSVFNRVAQVIGSAAGQIGGYLGNIRNAIEGTVNFIDRVWSGLSRIFRAPVEVLINQVYNNGIRRVWNATAAKLPGIGTLDSLPGFANGGIMEGSRGGATFANGTRVNTGGRTRGGTTAFARGGFIPGYAPGQDTRLAWVSPGEGVLVPEAVRGIAAQMGTSPRKAIQSINSTFSPRVPGFALGGLIPDPLKDLGSAIKNKAGDLKDNVGDALGSVKNWVQGKIAAGLGVLLKPVRAMVDNLIPGSSEWFKMVRRVPNTLMDKLLDHAKNKDAEYNAMMAAMAGSGVGGWGSADQQKNAGIIVAVGKKLGASQRDLIISLMTALQESGLRNISYGDRDSVGLFQQRTPWGTFDQRMNQAESARMFFQGGHGGQRGLFDIGNRGSMSLTQAAQAVQVSAFPNAYAKWEDEARTLLSGGSGTGVAQSLASAVNWARGQEGKPYVWGGVGPGGYDCSGFIGAIQNYIQGRSLYRRLYTTHSFVGGLPAGWRRGGGGAFSVGVIPQRGGTPGHIAGTINGVNVESRGGRGTLVGPEARGWRNSLFDRYFSFGNYARGGLIDRLPGDPPFDKLTARGRAYDPELKTALELADVFKFDSGGYLPPGVSMAVNRTGKPEPILTSGQWATLSAAVAGRDAPATAAPLVQIGEFHATPEQSPNAIAEDLHWFTRRRG